MSAIEPISLSTGNLKSPVLPGRRECDKKQCLEILGFISGLDADFTFAQQGRNLNSMVAMVKAHSERHGRRGRDLQLPVDWDTAGFYTPVEHDDGSWSLRHRFRDVVTAILAEFIEEGRKDNDVLAVRSNWGETRACLYWMSSSSQAGMGRCIYVIPLPIMRVAQPVLSKGKASTKQPAIMGPKTPAQPIPEAGQGKSDQAMEGGRLAIQDSTPSSKPAGSQDFDSQSQRRTSTDSAAGSQQPEQSQEPEQAESQGLEQEQSQGPEQEQSQSQAPEAAEGQPTEPEGDFIPPIALNAQGLYRGRTFATSVILEAIAPVFLAQSVCRDAFD